MKLQEKHLEAIQQSKSESYFPEYSEYFSEDMCREKATQITKDYMNRFAEWLISNGYILQDNGRLFKETQSDLSKDYSFNELIEIFLETEK